jgi:hypothetical protein
MANFMADCWVVVSDCRFRRIRILAAVVVLASAMPALAGTPPTLSERFRTEAPEGWKKLQQSLTPPLSGSMHMANDYLFTEANNRSAGQHSKSTMQQRFWISRDSAKMTFDELAGSGKWNSVYTCAFNPDYGFIVRRGAPDGPYTIETAGRAARAICRDDIDWFVIRMLESPFSQYREERMLAEIVKRKSVKLLSCSEESRDGQYVVRAEMQLPASWYPRPVPGHLTVWADPQMDWRVVRSESHYASYDGPLSTDCRREYVAGRDHPAQLKRYLLHTKYQHFENWQTVEFLNLSQSPIPESEFRLTSIGLPESAANGTSAPSSPWRWPLLGANIAVVALLLALLYRRRRRKSEQELPQAELR